MSPRRRGDRPPHLRVVPDWVREERGEPSHRPPAARGKGARRGFGQSWWGRAWVDAIEGRAQLDPNRLPRGRGYARSGTVGELDIGPGLVRASVQGSRPTPYDVTVRVRVFADDEWERVLAVVSAQVGRAAADLPRLRASPYVDHIPGEQPVCDSGCICGAGPNTTDDVVLDLEVETGRCHVVAHQQCVRADGGVAGEPGKRLGRQTR